MSRSISTKVKPQRVLVGPDYYFASGAVRSRTQLDRLQKSGRIKPFLYVGTRRVQDKDVADADIAALISTTPSKMDAA